MNDYGRGVDNKSFRRGMAKKYAERLREKEEAKIARIKLLARVLDSELSFITIEKKVP